MRIEGTSDIELIQYYAGIKKKIAKQLRGYINF
jgi:hypothetical protein